MFIPGSTLLAVKGATHLGSVAAAIVTVSARGMGIYHYVIAWP